MNASVLKIWVFFLLFFPLTMWLGFWQLDRADEKQTMLDRFSESKAAEVKELSVPGQQGVSHFSRWRLNGHYGNQNFLLDNRTRNGKVGYEVLTPFVLASGARVLINRGWVKGPRLRSELPEVGVGSQEQHVSIQVMAIERSADSDLKSDSEPGWPKRIQRLAMAELSELLGERLVPYEFRLVSDEQSGALQTGWVLTRTTPDKHHGYALQWFSLSLALLLLTVFASWKFWNSRHA